MNSIFKCTPPPKRNNCKGFTLSETLIAVAILGLLAAIVIPNMFRAYQQYQMVSKLKIAYALLNDVVAQSEVENGPISTWKSGRHEYYTIPYFEKYYKPYLKISKDCGYGTSTVGENNKQKWCLNGEQGSFNAPDGSLPATSSGVGMAHMYYKVILKNGMTVGVTPSGGSNDRHYILIDIDGKRGKSIVGKNVFFFTVAVNGASQTPGLYPGAIHRYMSLSNYKNPAFVMNNCTKNAATWKENDSHATYGYHGGLCAQAIIMNGWKVPSWYPW